METKQKMPSKYTIDKDSKVLERVYLILLFLLLILIVATPYIITGSIKLWGDILIVEEIVETVIIAMLLVIGYLVSLGYRREYNRHRQEIAELTARKESVEIELDEAFRYIGSMNVQIAEIQSIFSGRREYPRDQADFKKILIFFAERSLAIVNTDWVLFRIIKPETLRTLNEYIQTRGDAKMDYSTSISNKSLITGRGIEECCVVRSDQENLNLKVFCVLPAKQLTENQEVLIKAIVNELEMLFIIFTSEYYKESYLRK